MDKNDIISEFKKEMYKIGQVYIHSEDQYFFTEKELHSYFYHLCLENGSFILGNKLNLVHTEYPTPFKCSIQNKQPYFQIEENNSKKMRSHIDLVLLNPNFIQWCMDEKLSFDYVNGIRNDLFSNYSMDFYKTYKRFYEETKEGILLYALEFKYFRHTCVGIKYPKQSIKQDIQKLKDLKTFGSTLKEPFLFCENTKLLVFVGDKNKKISAYLDHNINGDNENYLLYYKR